MKKNVQRNQKIKNKILTFFNMEKLLILLLLAIGLLFITAPKTYATLSPYEYIDYTGEHLFAYNGDIYMVSSYRESLTGLTIEIYENDYEYSEEDYVITATDYSILTTVQKEDLFQQIYGTSEGTYYAEHYTAFEIHGGNDIMPLYSLIGYAYIKFLGQTLVYDTVTWSGGDLQTFLSQQENGYYSGNMEWYDIGYENGYEIGLEDGYDDGYTDGYDDGEIKGYTDGEAYGYADGYGDGLIDGYAAPESEKSILTFVGSTLGAIFSFIWLILTGPNILGIDLLTVFIIIGGIIVVIIGLKTLL